MDATCAIQASIHVFSLVRKYVSRILGTYQLFQRFFYIVTSSATSSFSSNCRILFNEDSTISDTA